MIKDTLYARYIKEREGAEVLENESGFIIYKTSDEECFIRDMSVDSNNRGSGVTRSLIDQLSKIAVSRGCSIVTANIDLKDKNSSDTLLKAIHLGFKVVRAGGDVLLIAKEIKGGI